MPTFAELVQDVTAVNNAFTARDEFERFVGAGGVLSVPELRSPLHGSCDADPFAFDSDKAALLEQAARAIAPDTNRAELEALLDKFDPGKRPCFAF